MSRFRRVAHGVASGYAVLLVTAAYGLASIPLALHYLKKEQYALWALMSTIAGYLALIDSGMSSSIARLLVDQKDKKETGGYGETFSTGWLVLGVQGTLIASAGYLLAHPLSVVLEISADLAPEFKTLVRWQSVSLGLGFALSIFAHVLRAHQRMDITNYAQMAGLALNLCLVWLFFEQGHGVLGLAWAALITAGCIGLTGLTACVVLKLLPLGSQWAPVSFPQFRAIFSYGKDLILVAIGTQLIMASQTMIVTRQMGLQAAAIWAVATRPFFLLCQAVWRISDTAGPALSEMIARNERTGLKNRYRAIFVMSASLAGAAGVLFSVLNTLFVALLTQGKVTWSPGNDVLLGLWLVVGTAIHVHNSFVLLTKKVGSMPLVYFAEGIVFVGLAVLVVPRFGFAGLITTSVVCSMAFSGSYGVLRISKYFEETLACVVFKWHEPMLRVLVILTPPALLTWFLAARIESTLLRFILSGALLGPATLIAFLRLGLARDTQTEFLRRFPARFAPVLRRLFALPGSC